MKTRPPVVVSLFLVVEGFSKLSLTLSLRRSVGRLHGGYFEAPDLLLAGALTLRVTDTSANCIFN